MASLSGSKSTRKTYTFEEREILVNLINKYLNNNDVGEEKYTEGNGNSKRKSVWIELTEEYNSLVGPDNTRSSIQLRRCWENMKTNKRNRDDKRVTEKNNSENLQQPSSNSNSLPPNVVFQSKDFEPFAFEGVSPSTRQKNDVDQDKDPEVEAERSSKQLGSDITTVNNVPILETEGSSSSKQIKRKMTSPMKKPVKYKVQKHDSKLHDFAILEAQLRLDTAALLKEEAKMKLQEAECKRDEARLRVICASYELQRLREDAGDVSGEEK